MSLGAPGWVYRDLPDASSDVQAVVVSATRQDIFVRGRALNLDQRVHVGAFWTGWINHGGMLTSEPRPVAEQGGQALVFVRGLDFGLWVIDVTAATPGTWVSLDGILTSAPAPVSQNPARFAVFVRGLDRALWYRVWDGAAWSPWETLKGLLATGPSAASTGAGRIDVAALDDAGALIHRKFDGTVWSEWRNLGGELTGDVALLAGAPDRIDVFARGKDDALWTIARTGETWSGWTNLGGKLTSAPAAARDIAGLHVYVRGGDGTIASRTLAGSAWSAWSNHGDGIGAIPDRRKTTIYRVSAADIVFRDYDYPAEISAGRLALRMKPGAKTVGNIAKGRRILLRSGERIDEAKVVATTPVAAIPARSRIISSSTSRRRRKRRWRRDAARQCRRGESWRDASRSRRSAMATARRRSRPSSCRARTSPICSRRPASTARRHSKSGSTANCGRRRRASSAGGDRAPLYGAPERQCRNLRRLRRRHDRRAASVRRHERHGDLSHGARSSGPHEAGQLSIPLERPAGLRSVTNPLPADGAADPETPRPARETAPNSVKTFGRAVSLADFEAIATATGLAAPAPM